MAQYPDPLDDLDAFMEGVDRALTEQFGPNHQEVLGQGQIISAFEWDKPMTVAEVAAAKGFERFLVSDEDGNDMDKSLLVKSIVSDRSHDVVVETSSGRAHIQALVRR